MATATPWPPEPWPAAWRAWLTGDGPRRRRGKAGRRPGESCGPEARGGGALARAEAAAACAGGTARQLRRRGGVPTAVVPESSGREVRKGEESTRKLTAGFNRAEKGRKTRIDGGRSFGGQQWRRRPADGPGRWRRGSGASLGGGDPVPVVGWADGGRRVALHGGVRAAALMEAGGASGRASRGPRNSARSEGEREEAKTNLATSTATTGLNGGGGRRRATRGHRRRERRRRSAACCAEGCRGTWQPREVPEESGFGRNQGRARWSWPGPRRGRGAWPTPAANAVTAGNREERDGVRADL